MSKTLVTGGAGFIGSSLTAQLLLKQNQVICVDDFNDYYPPRYKKENIAPFLKHKKFTLYKGDIRNEKFLEKVFSKTKPTIIIHLAARAGVRPSILEPKLYFDVNLLGTINLLELAKRFSVSQFILGSSSSIYGNNAQIPFCEDEQNLQPISPYGISKLAAEKECYLYNTLYGLPVTILRFFTVYGPKGRPDMAPYLFTKAILKGKTIKKFGDGTSYRDYTYIDDIVNGLIRATDKNLNFEIINLGNSTPATLNEFINTLELIIGKKAKIKKCQEQQGDVSKTYANINKAKKLLSWSPNVNLKEGLEKFVDWFLKNDRINKSH
jgi:UDP-glucuronate 4-epimerase